MLVAYLALVVHQLSQPSKTTSQTFFHKSQGRSTERHDEPKRHEEPRCLADTANAHPLPSSLSLLLSWIVIRWEFPHVDRISWSGRVFHAAGKFDRRKSNVLRTSVAYPLQWLASKDCHDTARYGKFFCRYIWWYCSSMMSTATMMAMCHRFRLDDRTALFDLIEAWSASKGVIWLVGVGVMSWWAERAETDLPTLICGRHQWSKKRLRYIGHRSFVAVLSSG